MDVGGDLRTRIQRHYDGLRPSEQLVADHLARTSGQRLDQSITEFARQIGVSEATVSRVSKALGFAGYPDMKLSIAAASHSVGEYPNIPAELHWSDSVANIGRKLATVLSASLIETEKLLSPQDLDAVVSDILEARKVVFMGVGGAAAICSEAAHIFMKIGIDATSYNDGYTQTVVAATLKPDCLLFAVSHTGSTPTVIAAVKRAKRNGVRTVGITGDPESALARAADTVFTTMQRAERSIPLHGDFLEGRVCQLYIIDVLYIGVMFRLQNTAKVNLDTTTQALADHYGLTVRDPQKPEV